MVISKITMGLGNQMFQYAAGRSLSLHKKVPYKVDIASYEGYHQRKYELESFFDISPAIASKDEIQKCQISQPIKRAWNKVFPSRKMRLHGLPYEETGIAQTILKAYDVISPANNKKTYIEPEYHYSRNFFKTPDDVYLIGYFMSWRYFERFGAQIKKDFTIRRSHVLHLDNAVAEIKATNSVSIHIRRGDFADQKNIALHGVIPIEFYKNGIEEIKRKVSNPHFYIFSDDINWVKSNLKIDDPVSFISDSISKTAVGDFYLMTVCKHNIIANSTFSWWAAYLNNNPEKIVIAPKKWYNQSSYDYKDVYPLSWTILNHL